MKLSSLLAQRAMLLRQARLANLAFAYTRLRGFAARISRAKLRGTVILKHAAPGAGQYWAALTAIDGNQSVIEEHFADEDISDLADIVAFTTGAADLEMTFPIEELAQRFLAPIRPELEHAGIRFDSESEPLTPSSSDNRPSFGQPQMDESG